MTLAIVLLAVWLLTVLTVVSLCATARGGDVQARALARESSAAGQATGADESGALSAATVTR